MPTIKGYQDVEVEVELDVSVDEFMTECNENQIQEIIDYLNENNYIPDDRLNKQYGVAEYEFESALNTLRNKWNMLTSDEETMILNIAKRF